MTLKSRNRLLKMFILVTALTVGLVIITFCFLYFTGSFQAYPALPRAINYPSNSYITKNNMYMSIASLFLLLLFVPISGLFLSRSFEKTQSPEVIYYTGFLTGCFLQTIRLCIPLFNLWIGYSSFLVFTARVNFAGQTICALSLWFASFFSNEDSVQEADKNLAIAFGVAVLFAVFIPVNPSRINSTFLLTVGYSTLFELIFLILGFVTFFAFIIRGKERLMTSSTQIGFLFLLFFTGYRVLSLSDSILSTLIGTALLYTCSFLFLFKLHKYYLWK